MTDMPRPRPPYLHQEKTRHGKHVWVIRRNGKRGNCAPNTARQSSRPNISSWSPICRSARRRNRRLADHAVSRDNRLDMQKRAVIYVRI